MAKGRRLSSSQSQRLLGMEISNNNYSNHYHQNATVSEVSEFGEEDVWSTVDDTTENHYHHRAWSPRAAVESGRNHGCVNVTCQQEGHVGGLSLAFEDDYTTSSCGRIVHQYSGATWTKGPQVRGRHVAASAPVNVPDWSKILRVNSAKSHDSDENDPVGDSGIEPPHEYLARSKKMNGFSVFEGIGRTLKGRDMSRVRDAVWSRTGFEG